jgi:hypothetical protein
MGKKQYKKIMLSIVIVIALMLFLTMQWSNEVRLIGGKEQFEEVVNLRFEDLQPEDFEDLTEKELEEKAKKTPYKTTNLYILHIDDLIINKECQQAQEELEDIPGILAAEFDDGKFPRQFEQKIDNLKKAARICVEEEKITKEINKIKTESIRDNSNKVSAAKLAEKKYDTLSKTACMKENPDVPCAKVLKALLLARIDAQKAKNDTSVRKITESFRKEYITKLKFDNKNRAVIRYAMALVYVDKKMLNDAKDQYEYIIQEIYDHNRMRDLASDKLYKICRSKVKKSEQTECFDELFGFYKGVWEKKTKPEGWVYKVVYDLDGLIRPQRSTWTRNGVSSGNEPSYLHQIREMTEKGYAPEFLWNPRIEGYIDNYRGKNNRGGDEDYFFIYHDKNEMFKEIKNNPGRGKEKSMTLSIPRSKSQQLSIQSKETEGINCIESSKPLGFNPIVIFDTLGQPVDACYIGTNEKPLNDYFDKKLIVSGECNKFISMIVSKSTKKRECNIKDPKRDDVIIHLKYILNYWEKES